MIRDFVLDASVTMSWCIDDERNSATENLLNSIQDKATAWVPGLWIWEVNNTLLVAERKKRATAEECKKLRSFLKALTIEIDEISSHQAWHDTILLAHIHNLSAYDAAYLELAMRRNLPLATLDQRLRNAAEKADTPVLPVT